jgi:uncharacterized protein (AIM24 family)
VNGDLMRQNEKLLERLLRCLVEELIKDNSIEEFELTPLHSFLTEFALPAGAYQRIRTDVVGISKPEQEVGRLEFPALFQAIFDRLNPYHHVSEIDVAFKSLCTIFQLPDSFLSEYEELIYGISSDGEEPVQISSNQKVPQSPRGSTTEKFQITQEGNQKVLEILLLGDGILAESGFISRARGEILVEPLPLGVLTVLKGMNAGRRLYRPIYRGVGALVFRPVCGDVIEMNLTGNEWILNPESFLAADLELSLTAQTAVKRPRDSIPYPIKIRGKGILVIKAPAPIHFLELKEEKIQLADKAFVARTAGFKHQIEFSREPGQESREIHILRGTGKIAVCNPPSIAD